MNDFRTALYQKYQSKFKKHIDIANQDFSESDYRYFKFKYLPLLNRYNLESSILDLGCGTGIMMQYLVKSGYKNIEGVDISEEQIEIAKSRGLNANVSDVFSFLESCKKYDIIFMLDFIEHFTKEELFLLMDKVNECINPGGVLILRTPNGNGIYPNNVIYGDLTHLTIFNSSSLIQLLKIFDFEFIEFFETGPIPKNLKGAIGFILWKLERFLFNIFRFIEVGKTEKYLTKEFICKATMKKD
ncbi:MAG: class I SAM-dependent methyltransferase [Ignavibacteriales bacterium]|nr:class I SAM-dependent methyltransferase [Ignavibacteriales bacterium]